MSVAPSRGRFITLEGGEGAGKSTQAELLVERLRAAGRPAIATREPGGSPGAEAIRQIVLSGLAKPLGATGEALLFSAARIDHLDNTIRPALAGGTWVVCDRFADSTRVYQGALGKLDPRFVAALERVVVGETRPDLTIILDIAPELGLERANARRATDVVADRFERESLAFHRALRTAFLDLAAAEPKRCAVIDASGDRNEVAKAIWSVVRGRLLGRSPRAGTRREAADTETS